MMKAAKRRFDRARHRRMPGDLTEFIWRLHRTVRRTHERGEFLCDWDRQNHTPVRAF
jgi:hypothetical protein